MLDTNFENGALHVSWTPIKWHSGQRVSLKQMTLGGRAVHDRDETLDTEGVQKSGGSSRGHFGEVQKEPR